MKFIQNTIDSENLQSSIIHGDLEEEMSSCSVQSVNSEPNAEKKISKENTMETVAKINNLTNGINGTVGSSTRCNGDVNGYYDEISDDDYQLVLESSSDEGGSPTKKIEEDTISAPQIVQEIEDLLGINANSVETDEELDKELIDLDSTESIDQCKKDDLIDEKVASNVPQEIKDVFEEQKNPVDETVDSKKDDKKDEKKEASTSCESTECDSSSNMNLVFDEVEIGTDSLEVKDRSSPSVCETKKNEVVNAGSLPQTEKTGSSLTQAEEENAISLKESSKSPLPEQLNQTNDAHTQPIDEGNNDSCKKMSKSERNKSLSEEEIALSHSSGLSEDSTEWIVLDTVVASDDEVKPEETSQPCSSQTVDGAKNIPIDKVPENDTENDCKNKSDNDCTSSIEIRRFSSGEESRKRTSSTDEQEIEFKRPKLEKENEVSSLVEYPAQKRPCSRETENETKRIKHELGKECQSSIENVCMSSTNVGTSKIESPKSPKQQENIDPSKIDSTKSPKQQENIDPSKIDSTKSTKQQENIDLSKTESTKQLENIDVSKTESTKSTKEINNIDVSKTESTKSIKQVENIDLSIIEPTKSTKQQEHIDLSIVEPTKPIKQLENIDLSKEAKAGPCPKPIENNKLKTDNKLKIKNAENNASIKVVASPKLENSLIINSSTDSCKPEESVKTGQQSKNIVVLEELLSADEDEMLEEKTLVIDESNEGSTQSNKVDSTPVGVASSADVPSGQVPQKSEQPLSEVSSSDKSSEKVVASKVSTKRLSQGKVVDGKRSRLSSSENKVNNEENVNFEVSSSSVDGSKNKGCNLEKQNILSLKKNKEKSSTEVGREKNSTTAFLKPLSVKNDQLSKSNENKKDKSLFDSNKHKSKQDVSKSFSSCRDVENLKNNSNFANKDSKITKSPLTLLTKHMMEKKQESKTLTDLDKAIDRVVDQSKKSSESSTLPLLKKFHKDQLKKLTRSELEEAVVLKVCEAITDRSEIGQMRLRCQTLEQNNDLWRKKALQFEKQNRELEMVLKKFLAETAQIKKDNENKLALPIKVTRSVGLQVVLASSMQGSLLSAKNKMITDLIKTDTTRRSGQQQQSQPQQQQPQQQQPQQQPQRQQPPPPQQQQLPPIRPKPVPKDPLKDQPKPVFTPPAPPMPLSGKGRGRPAKISQSVSMTATQQPSPSPPKTSPSTTPVKITKTVPTPVKDLEVIDLTEKDEKTKAQPQQSPAGGSIRVSPQTQVCFVQQNPGNSSPQQMAYLVQKPGQRQQYLVATSTPSPTRPTVTPVQQPPAALALPMFRAGGQLIPVQNTPRARTTTSTVTPTPNRQVPQSIRLQSQATVMKHPAPLPPTPTQTGKPSYKTPPPKPQLKIAKTVNGIMLSWSMTLTKDLADMASYQLYAYQESNQPPSTSLWKKVGDVKALPLPMACTLTQFIEGHKYHFSVRAVDIYGRIGPYSIPSTILLSK